MSTLKTCFGVLVLNALLAFPVLYQTYKHFSAEQTPMDVGDYMAMVEEGPEGTHPPFRYRVLAPLLVRAMSVLPGYGISVDFSSDPEQRRIFFHFLALNFALLVLASGLLFLYLRARVPPVFAWAGSLLYLFSFFTLTTGFIPMTDAVCQLAIIAAILLFDKKKPLAFLATCLVGVFAKETLLIVLVPWIFVHAVGDWRRLRYLALLLPALAAYLALTRWFPAEPVYAFYDPLHVLAGFARIMDPHLYSRTFLFHTVLGHLPLLAAFAAWAWLRWGRGVRLPLNRGLWVFFALLFLAIAMDIPGNAGRVAFMAFPALALFQARVMEGLARGVSNER